MDLEADDWMFLENARRGTIDGPTMCRLYADLTPESFQERAMALAGRGLLEVGGAKDEPMTFSLSEIGQRALDQRDRGHRDEVIRRTGHWQP